MPLPPDLLALLDHPPDAPATYTQEELHGTARTIEATLADHSCDGRVRVVETHPGPAITRHVVELCPPRALPRYIADIETALVEALGAVQVQIVITPDKDTLNVIVPNRERRTIQLRDVLVDRLDDVCQMRLPLALGLDVVGAPVIMDLAEMPHLLIVGTGASGKTALLQALATTLLLTRTPDQLRLVLADPSGYGFATFKRIPHMLWPVATDAHGGIAVLGWALDEMMHRFHSLQAVKASSISVFNERVEERSSGAPMAHIVVVIDELADLMMLDGEVVEDTLVRIAGLGRVVGLHLVVVTKCPTVNVITGLIKANVPAKMAFKVNSKVDSRVVLDNNGAERLLRHGDALFREPGGEIQRVHTPVVTDGEIQRVVEAVRVPGEWP